MRTIKGILLLLLLVAASVFAFQWLSPKKTYESDYKRSIKDTIDINDYSWQHMPDNMIGITSGDLSYLISAYTKIIDQQNTIAVTCFPVENASDLLTAANFKTTRQYVYRSTKTWFRQNKKSHLITKTNIAWNNSIAAHLFDSCTLLSVTLDTIINGVTFTSIDTTGHILYRKSFEALGTPSYKQLKNGSSIVQVDSILYLFARHQPVVFKVNFQTYSIKSYALVPGGNLQKDNPVHQKTLQNLIAKYDYINNIFCVLQSPAVKATLQKNNPIIYTTYLDFYNLDFIYQYSIEIRNLDPASVTDIALFGEELYLTAGRNYMSIRLSN